MWLSEHIPEPLLREAPFGLLLWQWIAIPVALFVAWAAGIMLGNLTRTVLGFLVRRTTFSWDDKILGNIRGPLVLAWTAGAAWFLLGMLAFAPGMDGSIRKALRMALFLAFFWFMARSVSVVAEIIGGSGWAQTRPASRSLVPLGARIAQVAVVAMAAVAVLADLGYPVASLVAGLGIGGLALALAAQKTVENLFGAFSIGVDQPFRVGDFIKVEDVQGNVEVIGLRSTRIRTPDRTLVTVPNGKLADMRIECFAPRDRIRLFCILALSRESTAAQVRAVIGSVEEWLKTHPKIWPEGITVKLREIGVQSLDIEVTAWFQTTDYAEFQQIRQDGYLRFLEIIEGAGARLAYPTRAVHLRDDRPPAPCPSN